MSTMISILGGMGLFLPGMTVITGSPKAPAGSALRARRSLGSTRYDGSMPCASCPGAPRHNLSAAAHSAKTDESTVP